MNIIAIVGCLCLLFVSEAFSAKKQSDREMAGLVKSVRVVREYKTFSNVRLKSAEVSKLLIERPYKTVTYDRKGVLLEEDNLYGLQYTYTYSAEGLRVKTANGATLPGSGYPIGPYVAERDANKYDKLGLKIGAVTYLGTSDATPWIRKSYEYDNQGRILRLSNYWRDSNLILTLHSAVTYAYNVKGAEEEVVWRDAAGALMDRLSYSGYKYDSKGNWDERIEERSQVYDKNQQKEQQASVYRVITYY